MDAPTSGAVHVAENKEIIIYAESSGMKIRCGSHHATHATHATTSLASTSTNVRLHRFPIQRKRKSTDACICESQSLQARQSTDQ